MQVIELLQGSDAWLEARLNHLTASEAPAMMGESPFMTRNQLLDLKKGWKSNPDGNFKKMLYQKGHEYEEKGRVIFEMNQLEDFKPLVGKIMVDGLELLASFDGINDDLTKLWEHKSWNPALSENILNGLVEAKYYWQLEHQLLVSGADAVWFNASNGTDEKNVATLYVSDPDRRIQLISGWTQFQKDLFNHQLTAKAEFIPASSNKLLIPKITAEVSTSLAITDNMPQVIYELKALADQEGEKTLETDQDFADKEDFNREVKKARLDLKNLSEQVQSKFVDHATFVNHVIEADSILQKMQSRGEKLVKDAKDAKKASIINEANLKRYESITAINEDIHPLDIVRLSNGVKIDFIGAVKGKRTIESLQNAVDTELARYLIDLNYVADSIKANLLILKESSDGFEFLFLDTESLVMMPEGALSEVITSRIANYEAAEKVKKEAAEKAKQESDKNAEKAESERKEAAKTMSSGQARVAEVQNQSNEEWIKDSGDSPPVFKTTGDIAKDLSTWASDNEIHEMALSQLKLILKKYITKGG